MYPGPEPRRYGLVAAAGPGRTGNNWVPIFPGSRRPYQLSARFTKGSGYRLPSLVQMQFLTAALKALEPRIDDDFVDRMNYYYTSTIIIMFAILVSAKQYVGHPIECWVPAQFTKAMEQYTENYCWIQNTYWVPFGDLIPSRMEDRERRQIGYYQWVPFILALEALMFYVPCSIWRMLSSQSGINLTGILTMATDDRNIEPDNRMHTVHILSRHIDDALRYQRDFGNKQKSIYLWAFLKIGKLYGAYVTILYCIVKILYLLNVIGQFVLLNRFLETADYPFFGAHIVWDLLRGMEWQNSGKFPRVTLCDFDIRVLGNIHRHTVQCVLVINMFTEKIFIFLWIWFLVVTIVTSVNFLFYSITLLIPSVRVNFVMKYLDLSDAPPDRTKDRKHLHRFVVRFLRPDGVFILRSVAAHSGTILSTELIYSLWLKYRETLKLPKLVADESVEVAKLPFEKLVSGVVVDPTMTQLHSCAEEEDEELSSKPETERFKGSVEDVPWAKVPPAPPPPKMPLLGNHKSIGLGRFLPESTKRNSPPAQQQPRPNSPGEDDDLDEGNMHYA